MTRCKTRSFILCSKLGKRERKKKIGCLSKNEKERWRADRTENLFTVGFFTFVIDSNRTQKQRHRSKGFFSCVMQLYLSEKTNQEEEKPISWSTEPSIFDWSTERRSDEEREPRSWCKNYRHPVFLAHPNRWDFLYFVLDHPVMRTLKRGEIVRDVDEFQSARISNRKENEQPISPLFVGGDLFLFVVVGWDSSFSSRRWFVSVVLFRCVRLVLTMCQDPSRLVSLDSLVSGWSVVTEIFGNTTAVGGDGTARIGTEGWSAGVGFVVVPLFVASFTFVETRFDRAI